MRGFKLNPEEFFYHFLKDLLPSEVFSALIKPNSKAIFDTVSQEIEKLSSDINMLRKAYAKTIIEDPFQVDDSIVDYLSDNFEILPIIHFIYMRKSCSFDSIAEIIKRNGISKSFDAILSDLKSLNLAIIDEDRNLIMRQKKIFRIPRTIKGIEFKDTFLRHEVQKSTEIVDRGDIVDPDKSFIHSSITCLNVQKDGENISARVSDLLASISSGEEDLESRLSTPFFISVIISPRDIYDVKHSKKIKKERSVVR